MLCFVLPHRFYVILGPKTNPHSENVLHGRCLDSFFPNPPMKSPRCNPEQFCHPNCGVGLLGHGGVPLHHLSSKKGNPERRDCADPGVWKEYPRTCASERRRDIDQLGMDTLHSSPLPLCLPSSSVLAPRLDLAPTPSIVRSAPR